MCRTIHTNIPCEPLAVRSARAWIRGRLLELYTDLSDEIVDDVGLAVSELVTNCVRADAHELTVSVVAHRGDVLVSTTDDAPGTPELITATPGMTSGRGLQIVAALTSEWGVSPGSPTEGHKTVWGRFELVPDLATSFTCDR